jgi:transcriptional regulator with XRE-family HTH domain
MKDRIIKFLTHENLTATKFADEIGVQRSSISHILSGRNNPSYDFIQKILSRYKNINADWLLLGTGHMFKKTEQIDLFTSSSGVEATTKVKEIPKQTTDSLSSRESNKTVQTVPEKEIIPSSRTVEKILIFYSDKTFDEFKPAR